MPKRITNTTREVADNPAVALAIMMGGTGRGVEAMEASGQSELVESAQIPTKLMHGLTEAMLVEMGFALGDPTPGDPLFRSATLPSGWSKRATGHAMWSEIVDGRCRKRLSIFYKAAFHDRDANMTFDRRYSYTTEYSGDPADMTRRIYLTDQGKPFGEPVAVYHGWGREVVDAALKVAKAVLAERYPDYRNPLAYWDED